MHRHLESKLKKLGKHFKVVLLFGARQVGKSTMLAKLFPNAKTFVFDPIQDLYGANRDPDLFLSQFEAPLILDEIQFAPELLPAIKRKVDQMEENGLYFLTGSQNLSLLKSVSESLAGRVAILSLDALTPYELAGDLHSNWLDCFLSEPHSLTHFSRRLPIKLYDYLWKGGFPGLLSLDMSLRDDYWSSYLSTYVERDVRLLGQIQDIKDFGRFMLLMAALTAQEINYSQLGREIGIIPNTAKRWCDLLEQTYQWNEISPYHGNTIKRVSKKPKGYIRDTGMACYLQKISSEKALSGNPQLGALFESMGIHLVHQLSKLLMSTPKLYHWRTNGGAEVDLILERDNLLYPIEFKCKSVILERDCSGIKAFLATYPEQTAYGAIIYAGEDVYQCTEKIWCIPWNACLAS